MTGKSFFSVKKTNLLISVLALVVPWAAQAASRPWWRLAAGNGRRRLEPDLVECEFNFLTHSYWLTLRSARPYRMHLLRTATCHWSRALRGVHSLSIGGGRSMFFGGWRVFLGLTVEQQHGRWVCWWQPMALAIAQHEWLGCAWKWCLQRRFLVRIENKRGKTVQFFVQYKKFSKYK